MLRYLILSAFISAGLATTSTAQNTVSNNTFTSDAGFSYNYPADWTVVNMQPMLAEARKDVEAKATSDAEKKGADCTQLALMLQHGEHSSMIEALVMPFDCTGNPLTEKDMSSIGMGMTQGLSSYVDTTSSNSGTYKRGTHTIWVDKITGAFKSRPEQKLQIDVVCGLLQKSLVCWMAFAYNDADLKAFENSSAQVEGDSIPQLVPADAFANSK
jgi:hypothetical protein